MVLDKGTQECQRMSRTRIQASNQHNTDSCQTLTLECVRWAQGPSTYPPFKSKEAANHSSDNWRKNGWACVPLPLGVKKRACGWPRASGCPFLSATVKQGQSAQWLQGNKCHLSLRLEGVLSRAFDSHSLAGREARPQGPCHFSLVCAPMCTGNDVGPG